MPNKTAQIASTQKYLNILAVRDGMVVLHDGAIRMILEVGSLNFALKSEDEQNGIIYAYQQFLNSLKFPIQIVMQSRRLDLYGYLKMLRELLEKQTNDLIRIQTEEYINFIERLLTKANIMDKTFYIVVPYFPSGVQKMTMIDKVLGAGAKTGEVHYTKEQFDQFKTELEERVNVISAGLGSMGLKVQPLNTQAIIELLYSIYNPAEAISERMTEVSNLESPIVKTDLPVQTSPADTNPTDQNQADIPTGQVPEAQSMETTDIAQGAMEDMPVVMNTVPDANIATPQNVDGIENIQAQSISAQTVPVGQEISIASAPVPGGQMSNTGAPVQISNQQPSIDGLTQNSQPIDPSQALDPLSQAAVTPNPYAGQNQEPSNVPASFNQ